MRTKIFSSIMAFAIVVIAGLALTSCYKSDTPEVLKEPVYKVCGNIFASGTGEPINCPVKVEGGSFSTTVNSVNGFYSVDVPTAPMEYTVTVDISGYNKATRTVLVPKVSYGQTGIGQADIVLFGLGSIITTKEVIIETPSPVDVLNDIVDPVEDATEAAIIGTPGADVTEIETDINADGTITMSVDYELQTTLTEDGVVKVPVFSGYYTDVKASDTKAVTAGEVWLAIVSQKFNLEAGLKSEYKDYPIPAQNNLVTSGYTVIYKVITKKVTVQNCDDNGKAKTGYVAYMESYAIIPDYESHDHGHGHDHGSNPGAGGGSSLPY